MDCSTPGLSVPHHLPVFAQVHVHWVGDAIKPSHPLLYPSPPALNLSWHQGYFQWVGSSGGQSIGASASVLPMNIQGWFPWELTGLISLQVQGIFKSPLQHQSSKASILWPSALFIVQLSHLYMATGKTIALTRWTFVRKVMSLLFNILSRFVIVYWYLVSKKVDPLQVY